jgi:hypothetical protein
MYSVVYAEETNLPPPVLRPPSPQLRMALLNVWLLFSTPRMSPSPLLRWPMCHCRRISLRVGITRNWSTVEYTAAKLRQTRQAVNSTNRQPTTHLAVRLLGDEVYASRNSTTNTWCHGCGGHLGYTIHGQEPHLPEGVAQATPWHRCH